MIEHGLRIFATVMISVAFFGAIAALYFHRMANKD